MTYISDLVANGYTEEEAEVLQALDTPEQYMQRALPAGASLTLYANGGGSRYWRVELEGGAAVMIATLDEGWDMADEFVQYWRKILADLDALYNR